MRPPLALSLVFASMAGLLACPQLLPDDFGSSLGPDADICARQLNCAAGAGGSGSPGGSAGAAGTTSGTGGSAPSAGGTGAGRGGSSSGGSGGSGGVGGGGGDDGQAGSAGAGGSGGSDAADASTAVPDPSPDCWLIGLNDTTHVASDNCLGILGWNDVENDAYSSVDNSSYEDDQVCFTGTVGSEDWGAVFNLTLNDTNPWSAVAAGIGGFQIEAEGESLPAEIQVVYSDQGAGDFCRKITPAAAVEVPFASAHPGCSTSSSSVTDGADLTHIRLVFLPAASDYVVDFCLGIRAIP